MTGHARRVRCLFLFSVSMCIIQHRNRPLKSTALNAHGTDASADGLCARTHTLTKPCRAGFAVSRSELIEPGAATCGLRDIAGPCVKFQKLGTVCARHQYTITFFFLFWKKICRARPQPTTLPTGRPTVTLSHAAGDTTAVRPALLMGGRGGSAVDIVVVERGTSSSVGRVLGNRFVEGRRN